MPNQTDEQTAKFEENIADAMHSLMLALVAWGNGGYHPDNPASDYKALNTPELQQTYDAANRAVCEYYQAEVYTVAMHILDCINENKESA